MYVYNGWKSARLVPVPIVREGRLAAQLTQVASLDIEYWITDPLAVLTNKKWVPVSKEGANYAVFFL